MRRKDDDINMVLGTIEFQTLKAWLFRPHYSEDPVWLPKSQCNIVEEGDNEVVMAVPSWLMKKSEGLQE